MILSSKAHTQRSPVDIERHIDKVDKKHIPLIRRFGQVGSGNSEALRVGDILLNANFPIQSIERFMQDRLQPRYPDTYIRDVERIIEKLRGDNLFDPLDGKGKPIERTIKQRKESPLGGGSVRHNVNKKTPFDRSFLDEIIADTDKGQLIGDHIPTTCAESLSALYKEDDLICAGWSYTYECAQTGEKKHSFKNLTKTLGEWLNHSDLLECDQIVPNPMIKRTGKTKTGKESQKCLENASPTFKFMVVECDEIENKDEQMEILTHLGRYAPLVMIVDSGGKSLHGWFDVQELTPTEQIAHANLAIKLGGDKSAFETERYFRMPYGKRRSNGNLQKVIHFGSSVVDMTHGVEEFEPATQADLESHEDEKEADDFPLECLPDVPRKLVEDMMQSRSVPASLVAPCVLSAISVAMGAGVQIQSGRDRWLNGNTYSVIMADSGSGKGETYKIIFDAITKAQRENIADIKEKVIPSLSVDIDLLRGRKEAINKEIKAADGVATQTQTEELKEISEKLTKLENEKSDEGLFMTKNTTSEKLISMIGAKKRGEFAVVSEEGKETLAVIFGKYRNDGGTDESVYLSGYSCEEMTLDRRGEGKSVRADRSCLSMMLMIQPTVGERYFSTVEALESGLLARMFLVNSEATVKLQDSQMPALNPQIKADWDNLLVEIIDIIRNPSDIEDFKSLSIYMTSECLRMIDDWVNPKIGAVIAGQGCNASIASRWGENAKKLALILHVAEHGGVAADPVFNTVSEETVRNACRLMDWYIKQHAKATADVEKTVRQTKLEKLISIIGDSDGKKINLREACRKLRATKKAVEKLIKDSKGMLELTKQKGKTKPMLFISLAE